MNMLKLKAWSPYAAGLIIGLLQIPGLLIVHSPLGASSAYVSAAAYSATCVDPGVHSNVYFEKHMTSNKYLWQGCLLIGIVLGAYTSMKLSGAKRKAISPIWKRTMGCSTLAQRLALGFIAGAVMLFGARWAGGCTSGHGLSGMGQLALSSLIVTICFFAGGMLTANLFKRNY